MHVVAAAGVHPEDAWITGEAGYAPHKGDSSIPQPEQVQLIVSWLAWQLADGS
jgi:hypothetical protein